MFLANASTKRPIAMSCLLIALIVLGLNSYRKMSIEDMPAVDIPYVTVITTWVGASPEDVEKDISKHIEDAVSGIDGLKHIESSSLDNVSQVVLEFKVGTDVDVASQDVREKVDVVLSELPANADRPVIQKVNVNASAVATIFLSGDAGVDELYDYADNRISDRFASVPGVASVDVIGGNEREVWVELDRDKLAASGLTAATVAGAMQSGILSLPGGRLRENGSEISVRFDAEYSNIDEIGDLEVASVDGARVKVRDLGTVRLATEEVRQRAIMDGRQGVVIKVVKKAEGNVVSVVEEVAKRFETIKGELPGGMELTWVSDESEHIRASVDSAVESVLEAVVVCAIVLMLFLMNFVTTIIVTITMPVTICISLFFMQLAGQSLNTVTLIAIGLSTGVLVSNSIVVLENIVSKMKEESDPWKAAADGASEVAISVLASAGTNVIVMLPLTLMTSLVGMMLGPFAITTLIVNASSIFISFTLTPILSAMWLKPRADGKKTRMQQISDMWDAKIASAGNRFGAIIRLISKKRVGGIVATILFAALFLVSMKSAGSHLGFTFMLNSDQGRSFIRIEFPPYYDLNKTVAKISEIEKRLQNLSDLDHTLTVAGKADAMSGQANEGVYMGQIELFFKSKLERTWTMDERLEEIRKLLADETDALIAVSVPGSMGGGQSFQIDYILQGSDLDELENIANGIKEVASDIDGLTDFDTTVRDTKPEMRIVPKRTIISDLGITASSLGSIVRANIDGIEAASYKKGDRTYDIRVKQAECEGSDVKDMLLPGIAGRPITLASVADVIEGRSKLQIYRVDKERTIKILGNPKVGYSTSDVANTFQNAISNNALLKSGYDLRTSGMSEMMGEAIADFAEAILLAAFLTLLTLAAILESWVRPGLVLLTLPMGLIGVVWGLYLSGNPLTILVLLGILMLIGVVVNAAILIVDKMGQLVKSGFTPKNAMCLAVQDQFRPVLMVVLASGLGMLPIALASGIGCENRIGMGISSVAGILVSGILTLTILPLMYNAFQRK